MRIKDEEITALRETMVGKDEASKILQKRITDLEKEAETFRAFVERKKDVIERKNRERQSSDVRTREFSDVVDHIAEEDLFEVVTLNPEVTRLDFEVEKSDSEVGKSDQPASETKLVTNSSIDASIDPDLLDKLRFENAQIRAENIRLMDELRQWKESNDGENPSSNKNSSEMALVHAPQDDSITNDPSLASPLPHISPTNGAVLDSYILSQSPVFYFLAQHLETAEMPKFDHKWNVGIGGEDGLEVTATWTPPPSSHDRIEENVDENGASSSSIPLPNGFLPLLSPSSAVSTPRGATTPKRPCSSSSKRVWTITPLLMPKQKINKKSLRQKLRDRHLQRIKAQLMTRADSTTSLPALMPSSCLTGGTSSNASTDELFLHIPNLASITSTPGRNTPSRALTGTPHSELVVDRGELKGVVEDQLERGFSLTGELNNSFAAVIRLQESIYLLRHRVDKCFANGATK